MFLIVFWKMWSKKIMIIRYNTCLFFAKIVYFCKNQRNKYRLFMRIGFDAKRIFFNHSGLGNYGRNIFSALLEHYPIDEYFLFSPKPSTDFFQKEWTNVILPQKMYKWLPSLWRNSHIGHDTKRYNLDIYHGLSNELPQDIRVSKTKSVVTIHDVIFMRYPQWYKWHDRMIYKKKTEFACRTADTIIATSYQTKQDLIHFLDVQEDKIQVIYQPCNIGFSVKPTQEQQEEIRKKYNLPAQFLLMVGNIEPRKNILNVINAVQNRNIDVPLVIVGKQNMYAKELKNFIAQNNIKNVYFCHNVCSSDLPTVYNLASVFVYPSFFEGFGIPIIEALSSGVPVITSKASCLVETGGDAALYVKPDSVEDITVGIKTILDDTIFRNEIIKKGEEQVKKFAQETIAKEIMDLYKRL